MMSMESEFSDKAATGISILQTAIEQLDQLRSTVQQDKEQLEKQLKDVSENPASFIRV